ncbi:MAG: tRNA pseudouridine(55) synthase TruB [Gammaproteobacteria bacterium]|nr:tRNA pseudouridine(55) synthase TruB [Gammaproteobacteria bacterium]
MKKNKGRRVDGILLLDKPLGLTSNAALQQVKRYFQANKVGHTGSLDPLASGLLPLCLGEATKFSGFLLDADKAYTGVCQLGKRTTTADAEGAVIEELPVPDLTPAQLTQVLQQFVGTINQIPPMHSALKVQGQPLYKLAHQGMEVERQPRQVTIHELALVAYGKTEFQFLLHCSKGTYVRTLAEDIGRVIGCGAYLSGLRRTQVGPFYLGTAITLDHIATTSRQGVEALDALLLPMQAALDHWPAVLLTDHSAYYVRQGQPVQVQRTPTSGMVRLFTQDEQFLGVGEILDDGRVAPRRLVDTPS